MIIDLARDWINATEGQLSGNPLTGKDEETVVSLFELVSDNPDAAVEVILQVIEQEPDQRVLNCLGAGPIEDLLGKHPEYLKKLIAAVRNLNSLRSCLTHVNVDDGSELEKSLTEAIHQIDDSTPR